MVKFSTPWPALRRFYVSSLHQCSQYGPVPRHMIFCTRSSHRMLFHAFFFCARVHKGAVQPADTPAIRPTRTHGQPPVSRHFLGGGGPSRPGRLHRGGASEACQHERTLLGGTGACAAGGRVAAKYITGRSSNTPVLVSNLVALSNYKSVPEMRMLMYVRTRALHM